MQFGTSILPQTSPDLRQTSAKNGICLTTIDTQQALRPGMPFLANISPEICQIIAEILHFSDHHRVAKQALRPGVHGGKAGSFRASFEDKPLLSDIIFLRAWIAVDLPRFYNPVTNLLAPAPAKRAGLKPHAAGDQVRSEEIQLDQIRSEMIAGDGCCMVVGDCMHLLVLECWHGPFILCSVLVRVCVCSV